MFDNKKKTHTKNKLYQKFVRNCVKKKQTNKRKNSIPFYAKIKSDKSQIYYYLLT